MLRGFGKRKFVYNPMLACLKKCEVLWIALIAFSIAAYQEYAFRSNCKKKHGVVCLDECVIPGKLPRFRRWYNGEVMSHNYYLACGKGIKCIKNCVLSEDDPI